MAKTATAKPKAAAAPVETSTAAKRSYFLTYLLPTSYTESELATFNEKIATLVTKHKGKVTNTESWGKKKMAYQIKHSGKWHTEANYVHLTVELVPAEAQALEKDMYLNPNVIRHLFVLAENNQAE
jgi:small subunit ribosomal protein S6